jgi:hypothetical protein
MTITTADARAFTARRQAAGASNASINRDLILLKRMCTLAMQVGKLTVRPYIPLLKESNIRKGFFEPEQFQRIKNHLPVPCSRSWSLPTSLAGGRRARLVGRPWIRFSAMISVLLSLLLTLRGSVRSHAALRLKVLALRHQLQVLQRTRPRSGVEAA